MIFELTILNALCVVQVAGIILFTIIHFKKLAGHGGWGILAMVGLLKIVVLEMIIDMVLQQYMHDSWLHVIEGVVGVAVSFFLIKELK